MKDKLSMIVFVVVLGSVLTTAIVAVNAYTAPLIEKHRVRTLRVSVLKAFGIAYSESEADQTFLDNVMAREQGGKSFYVSRATGDVAFAIEGSGLWGPIRAIVAIRPDLETVKGITIIHQEETPGLGARIAEAGFLDRFKDKRILPRLTIQPPGKAAKDNEVDGITGATLSCKAFEDILNNEIRMYLSAIKESK